MSSLLVSRTDLIEVSCVEQTMSSDRRALPSKRASTLSQRNKRQVLIGLEHLRNLGSHSGSCLHNASTDNDTYFFGLSLKRSKISKIDYPLLITDPTRMTASLPWGLPAVMPGLSPSDLTSAKLYPCTNTDNKAG